MDDKLREECGVFGIWDKNSNDVAKLTYYALFALQHRGQESAGIAVCQNEKVSHYKDLGLVNEVFDDQLLSLLKGQIAVGHVRYATAGANERQNAQPLVSNYIKGSLAISHNGNIVNADALRKEMEKSGTAFQTNADSEVITCLLAKECLHTETIQEAISHTMEVLEGAYSVLVMTGNALIGFRDPLGIRPLCIGKLQDSYVMASETCALDAVGATFVRDVAPGEIVTIDQDGITSVQNHCKGKHAICMFEYIYFARADSVIEGTSVYEFRKRSGKQLAIDYPVEADLVLGVPDSGIEAAIGFSEASGIPYGIGFSKNKYVGRTFIQPTQIMRETAVRIKLNVIASAVKGKRVVMVDDSIVRGTTFKRVVKMIRDAGAVEVHVRIASPQYKWPCYFGTDIPSKEHLAACKYENLEGITKMLGADSLRYLDIECLHTFLDNPSFGHCDACFSGNYPLDVDVDAQRFTERSDRILADLR